MEGGWIKLYRKMLDNPIVFKDSDYLAVWVYLLLNATHNGCDVMFHGEKIRLEPGQLTTGRKVISEKIRVSESKVQRILKRFESEQQIEQRTDHQCRLISILNWNEYQDDEQRIEQQMNNDRTTSEQRVNTKQECKNNNISSKLFEEEFETLWKMYPKKEGKKKSKDAYIRARKSGTSYDDVEAGIIAYKEHIKSEMIPKQYIKMGSTYFNGRCWEDIYEEPVNNTKQTWTMTDEEFAAISAASERTELL